MNKTALITGASRGIGAAIAKEFAANNYNLAICCLNSSDKLFSLAKELQKKYKITVLTFVGDVSDYNFVKSMVDSTLAEENLILYNKIDSLENIINVYDEELTIAFVKLERIKDYNAIAAKGNNIKYLRGWINRVLNE